jgi:hypothetical protein
MGLWYRRVAGFTGAHILDRTARMPELVLELLLQYWGRSMHLSDSSLANRKCFKCVLRL